jgi:hypothetical protein
MLTQILVEGELLTDLSDLQQQIVAGGNTGTSIDTGNGGNSFTTNGGNGFSTNGGNGYDINGGNGFSTNNGGNGFSLGS